MNTNTREPGGGDTQGAEGAGPASLMPGDFGDLEQYVELNPIGTGEQHSL